MSDVASGALHAGKMVGGEAFGIVLDYLVPIGAGLAGFAAGPSVIGGAASIANATYSAFGAGKGPNANLVGGAVFAVIYASIGGAFWHMRSRGGWIMKIIGGGVGAFFFGSALSLLIFQVGLQQVAPSGALDSIFAWIGDKAVPALGGK
jgi:hypothetical protein